jgi:exodeoxyribonuclease V beta subunit
MVERGLAVDKILVVTYTKAATEELKSRIRNRLLAAKSSLSGGAGEDGLVRQIVQRGIEPQQALRRIQDALVDFDRAAIFTIHGFCQRVLHHFAFETGHLFQAELAPDVQSLVQEAADDFWRRHISRAPVELVRYVLDQAKGPEALAELCHASRFPRARVVPPARKPPLTAIAQWRRLAAQVHAMSPHVRDDVCRLLLSEGLNAVQYGKCNPDPENSGRRTVVDGLSAAMDQWDAAYPIFERFEKFCQSCLLKATKKKYPVPKHSFFDLCDQLSACRNQMDAQMADYLRYLKVRWLKEFERRLSEKKARENLLFFDDLLSQVHTALKNADLLRAIRMQYHAALVDEFQDTDALQYEIFTALFSVDPSLLFMIGDPKQAIYSFRGADLFSYLQAKRHSPHRYTLTSNWRATPSLIKALNTVFGRCARPFGYEQIPYAPAVAATNAGDSEVNLFICGI